MRSLGLRQIDAVSLLDLFILSGVVTVLITRFYLMATGYPQVGNGVLHIAHAVWGGLLMAIAIMAGLALLSRPARPLIAIAGGIGFGLFVDEIGKFITRDVDYFFRPAATLIYISFMVMYLAVRVLVERPRMTETEWLANAADIAGETASRPLAPSERARLGEMVGLAPADHPLTVALAQYVRAAPARPEPPPGWTRRTWLRLRAAYLRIVVTTRFRRLVTVVALLYAVAAVGQVLTIVLDPGALIDPESDTGVLVQTAATVASLVQGVFVIIGVVRLRSSRPAAYRWLSRALLVNILLVQVFLFGEHQFGATTGLVVSLIALGVIRTLQAAEDAEDVGAARASQGSEDRRRGSVDV